eukprot:8714672-Alexandrium_andersonii.AAC.1
MLGQSEFEFPSLCAERSISALVCRWGRFAPLWELRGSMLRSFLGPRNSSSERLKQLCMPG